MLNEALFSSKKEEWETPQALFDELDKEFHFDVDVCALPENAKCDRYYTPEIDGLKQSWQGVCWCNPPYGRKIGEWVAKAAKSEAVVVMLLPARTDTRWFHDYIYKAENADIRFIRGRLKFGGGGERCAFSVNDCNIPAEGGIICISKLRHVYQA